jgi:hypothetical protein
MRDDRIVNQIGGHKEHHLKYAWLGAGGVAGELPSGVITQDGVTYVPQTGRALQTEGVPLPAPQNAAKPFVRTITPWAAAVAAAEGAHQIALGEEESRKREEANRPVGVIPVPEAGEEAGGGGEEEGESPIIGYLPFEHEGGDAHTAGHIECGFAEGNGLPHESSHNPGFVNWTILFVCNAPVLDVRVRLALFWEGEQVSETGYVRVGTTAYWKNRYRLPAYRAGTRAGSMLTLCRLLDTRAIGCSKAGLKRAAT